MGRNEVKNKRQSNSDTKLYHLPEELLTKILLNLPLKLLVRFQSVSKSCYSLITNHTSIQAHLKNSSRNSFIILTKKHGFSIHHDNASLLEYTEPKLPSHILNPSLKIHGSSNGLICFSNDYTIYLWNPALGKLKTLPMSLIAFDSHTQNSYRTNSIAFGFHPGVNDYKVVRIFTFRKYHRLYFISEVYNLRRDCWRRIEIDPSFYFVHDGKAATVNGAAGLHYGYGSRHLILRFEMGEEVFGEVSLPEHDPMYIQDQITVFGESVLCLLQYYRLETKRWEIWTMENCGDWTKRFSMHGEAPMRPLGFRKSGELLLLQTTNEDAGRVESYNFETKRVLRFLGIRGDFDKAYPYVESLVQLDGGES